MWFLNLPKREELVLILDINSGSVGLALVLLTKNVPIVKFSVRQEFVFQKLPNPKKLMTMTTRTLEILIENAKEKLITFGKPQRIVCFLSSHLCLSQTRIVKVVFDKSTLIDKRLLQNMVTKDIEDFKIENIPEGSRAMGIIIEKKVMKVMLNGYDLNNYEGKKAREIELSYHITLIQRNIFERLKELTERDLQGVQTEFHSFAIAAFTVSRDIFKDKENFLLINMDDEITEVSFITSNTLERSTSIPFGKNNFIRNLITATTEDKLAVDSLIKLSQQNMLLPPINEKMWGMIKMGLKEWSDYIKKIIMEEPEGFKNKQFICLFANEAIIEIIEKVFSTEVIPVVNTKFQNNVLTLFSRELIKNLYQNDTGKPTDLPMSMLALFANKTFKG